ncbi:DNA helicase Rep, partial [Escherichia coli]
PYVPGWDCHGLPIELKVEQEYGKPDEKFTAAEFRAKCREYAATQVDGQRKDFIRLGVLGDWSHPYLTMDFKTEANIIRALGKIIGNGHLHKGAKPVHWCVDCRSALAEAEVEYYDKTSPSIDVAFQAVDQDALKAKFGVSNVNGPISLVIWTTTPWTLPANRAISIAPDFDYALVQIDGQAVILAKDLVESVMQRIGVTDYTILGTVKGAELELLRFAHPFMGFDVPAILGDHVTLDAGTGAVHTAPGHGPDDYVIGQKYGLETANPVGPDGTYLPGTYPTLDGVNVFKANDIVGYQARHIAAVTFTNKAAREMKERVGQTLGRKEARGLMISTFHTLGLDIIKREYAALGMKANFSLFDDTDQLALLKELTEGLIEDDKVLLQQLISTISNWKNDLKTPAQAAAEAKGERDRIFAHCYGLYDAHLKACNVLDFDDLILLPTLLLQRNEEVRERWQNKIRYLLVDEYQDTNTSQYELVKLLVGSRARFTVVGDDDQSIYSWRGARPQNLVLLSQDFPALKVIKLEQNYRSSGRILKAANILIANNPHVFEKRLFSELGYGTELKVLSANNEEHEAERVTGELIAHHFVNKTQYKDYAILYRGNHQSRVFEKFLMQNRIPYKISGGTSFFSRPEIKDLLAYLRVLTNPDDDSAFLRIVNTPKREIGPATLKKLGEWAMTRNKSMFTASFDMGLSQTLSGRGYEALTRFTHWLAEIQRLAEREPIAAVRDLIHGMDYESWLYETSPSPKAAEMRMKNVNQLFSWMTEMLEGSELDEPMTLTQVVTRFTLRDMMERGESEEELDQVQLMTLHASKGLEFPYVYMVGMEEGFLPHQSSIDEDNIDEERRLAYVGITRAQKELTFTLCKERRQYGELVRPEPSRFLLELPQDDLIWEQERKVVSAEERMQKGQSHLANLKAMMAAKRGK